MEINQPKSQLKAIVQQVASNSTSWIGHFQGETMNRITGQTFLCNTEGKLDCIEVFSTIVADEGAVNMTIHEFDQLNKSWGPVLGSSQVELTNDDADKWIVFPVDDVQLHKETTYGFRLKSDTGLIGVGETACSVNNLPIAAGQEWVATDESQKGNYYTYLSLAFKVELRA